MSIVHSLFAPGVGMLVCVVHAGHLLGVCLTVAVVPLCIRECIRLYIT